MNLIRSRSRSRNRPLTFAQLEEQRQQMQQNHAVLRESVTDEAILKSGQLTVLAGTTREEQIEKIEEIDNLVKSHPIKQLHSKDFRAKLCEKRENVNPIYLNPYLVGITYLRRLAAHALPAANGQIGSIDLTQDMRLILETMASKEWSKKLTGTIFTADDYRCLDPITARLKHHGAIRIGTETGSQELQGAWAHVSGGSLTFAINDAADNNKAHDLASQKHLYAITGYRSWTRFTITARNYSDLRWITSCVVDEIGRKIEDRKVITILNKVKAARINSVLHNLAGSLRRGDNLHQSYIKYGKEPIEITTKVGDVSVLLKNEPDRSEIEKEVLEELYDEYHFIIALPGHLIIDDGIKKNLECMTVPLNEKLAMQANVPEDDEWLHTNLEIYRRVKSSLSLVHPDMKNDLFEFGRQVCSALDRHSKIEQREVENRVNADEAIPEE